jgi:alpha-D-ribose 1-methylphosphonate 5-triphosphate synthase subunit PhnI
MLGLVAVFAVAISLTACGVADTLVDGLKHAKAVGSALEASTGAKPEVGFNWNNGNLRQVTVIFPRLVDDKPMRELAELVRRTVSAEFKQTPGNIVLGFSLGKSAANAATP